jgi:hypothetical protein
MIAAREAAAAAVRAEFREQIATLADELTAIAAELADPQTTRQTLVKFTHEEVTSPEPAIISEPYRKFSPTDITSWTTL